MKPDCPVCHGTGMTRSGFLDCMFPGCDAAERRADFNRRLDARMGIKGGSLILDVAWQAHLMTLEEIEAGKASSADSR